MTDSFSMRKIPVNQNIVDDADEANNSDNVKILELSNNIDLWEKEILFSDKGFFSLKGKETENKTKEFICELENFINSQINSIQLQNIISQEKLLEIKKNKINAVKSRMEIYEKSQLEEWERQVYDKSLNLALDRAVLYKNNPEVISSSYNNALIILSLMARKEQWDAKTILAKKEEFESDFYFSLINAFMADKDINASIYFNEYKDKLNIKDKDKLERSIEQLKNYIIAYNWAKELFSYNLSDDENEKELKSVKDKNIETLIRKFLSDFKSDKEKTKNEEEKKKNETNWQLIKQILSDEPDKAVLYIDYTLSNESIKNKKEYIKKIQKNGFIQTDEGKFIDTIKEIYTDYENFLKKDTSDLYNFLSEEDFKIIQELKNQTSDKYNFFVSDYNYIENFLKENSVNSEKEIYNLIKFIMSAKNSYTANNKREPDIESRKKIIDFALERIIKK